ncbi:MAG: nucleotidyl transferase AbiEii/AbiGii toxin family protein [Chthoniobacterales bacterium]
MKASSAKAIFRALDQRGVRYLIAGGIAVNAYGYLRFTKDIDFVVELIPKNIVDAFAALETAGYHPNVPITAEQFAEPGNRRRWMEEKDMKVLQFWSDQHRETPVDVFISVPFDFDAEVRVATWKELRDIGAVPVVTLPTLVSLKRAANREQDRIDLDNLRLLYPKEITP